LRIATIEEYKKTLSQKGLPLTSFQKKKKTTIKIITLFDQFLDAILEQNIYTDALSEYLKLGGAPMDAVNLLSESYIGIPSMCNATSTSMDSIGLNSDTILRRAIRHQLQDRFDPKRCDEFFDNQEMAPEWLEVLIQDVHWRQTLYELLEKYPNSQFLNFAILVSSG
jgi:hypothetical protein